MQFTDKYLKGLKPTDKVQEIREARGFGIKVYPSGEKTFYYRYHFDGRKRFLNLGRYPDVSLMAARRRHSDASKLVEQGQDPSEVAQSSRDTRRTSPTVAKLCEEYIEKHAKKFKRSWQSDERLLNVEIVPIWGKQKAEDVKKRDVTLLLESVVNRGTPAMSNQILKVVRKMFNFAVERDILQQTPFTGVKALAPNTRRERKLNEVEIKILWERIDSATMSSDVKRALKLVLVTAQRPGEVSGMHTSEIDNCTWTIPAGRAKNGREHRVHLTQTALGLIGPLTILNPKTCETQPKGFIFRCPHLKKEQPIDSHSLPVAVRRNLAWPREDKSQRPLHTPDGALEIENRLGINPFTPHDLRRTAATFMAELGQMDEVIDAVLNHAKQGIIGTYNLYRYDKEKRLALEIWEHKLLSIISK